MTSLNVDNLKLTSLLSEVEAGEEFILEKSGEPIAKIIPIKKKGKRILGTDKGKVWMSEDFTGPLPDDLLSEFNK